MAHTGDLVIRVKLKRHYGTITRLQRLRSDLEAIAVKSLPSSLLHLFFTMFIDLLIIGKFSDYDDH